MPQEPSNSTAQVDLVTEALIREHLAKKKFSSTLSAYNSELPKSLQSISKRSILQQLLGLEQAAQAEVADAKSQNKICTTSSILELWVKQQLAQNSQHPASDKHCQPATARVERPDGDRAPGLTTAGEMPRRNPGMQASVAAVVDTNSGSSRFGMSGGAAGPAAVGPSQHSMLPGHSTLVPSGQLQEQQAAVTSAPLQGSASPAAPVPVPLMPRPLPAVSAAPKALNQPLQPLKGQLQPLQRPGSPGHVEQPSDAGLRAAAAAFNAAAVVQSSQMRSRALLEQQFQNELVLEDLDEDELSSNNSSIAGSSSSLPVQHLQAPAGPNRMSTSSSSSSSGSGLFRSARGLGPVDLQPLLPEQQKQLSVLLWGDPNARPDAAWGQGLVFSTVPGLEWGLVQNAGGPCGVLAAVQAHLMGTLMELGLWGAEVAPDMLLDALVHSLAVILWTARSSSCATVVVLPQATAAPAARGLCDAAQLTRSAQMVTAASMQQLEGLLKAAMPQYCARKGWGLLLLLYSLLLTRGCAITKQDMDDPSTCLIDHHGYCSMELVNLMLTGVAVSNVFDGKRQLDAADSGLDGSTADDDKQVLRGVASQARVGLLTLFEWYRYVEVGQNLKCPKLPVWVVCSESHFTMLALDPVHWQQGINGAGTGLPGSLAAGTSSSIEPAAGAAVVLEFYDGMANAECSIKLSILPAAGRGWSSKLKDVADDRGTWQGRPIPPLECVIETKWPDVQVIWHGTDPIL